MIIPFHAQNKLVMSFIPVFATVIKRQLDCERVAQFDKKLQRSYFVLGKKL